MGRFTVVLALVLPVSAAAAGNDLPTGWRHDGRGLYPDATPPIAWSREVVAPVLKTLSCQADKPRGDDPAAATAMPKGHIPVWLGVGPFPAEGEGRLDTDYLEGEASVQPSAGDKTGARTWQTVTPGRKTVRKLTARTRKKVCYLHTYLHAATGGRALLQLSHAGGLKVYLNGTEIYKEDQTASRPISRRNAMRRGDYRRYVKPGGPRVSVTLKPGWNRLLLKSFDGGNHRHVYLRAQLREREDVEYRSRNIRWVTRLPDWGVGSPIVVKDRIFVSGEPDLLVCLDKKTGKILWTRSTPIYAAVTEAERKAHPGLAAIDPLVKELENSRTTDENRRLALRMQIQDILHKVDRARYAWPTSKGLPASGLTFPTPVSDGEHVYVFYTTSIAACYDMAGKRRWIRNMIREVNFTPSEFKSENFKNASFNVSAPILVGDKLILLRSYMAALDKNTGRLLWKSTELHGHSRKYRRKTEPLRYGANFSATPTACRIGGEDVIVGGLASVIRARDGKLLVPGSMKVNNPRSGFAWDGGKDVWFIGHGVTRVLHFEDGPGIVKLTSCPEVKRWPWPAKAALAAPLYYDGLVYVISQQGILTVCDAAERKILYEREGVLDPAGHNRSDWLLGCCSSPTLGGKHIYIMDDQLNTLVIKPGRQFEQIAKNRIANLLDTNNRQDSPMTNPVFDGDCIYIRGERDLFCIGK